MPKNAIALLKADHRKVEGLFDAYEAATTLMDKRQIARAICVELTVHTMIEEEIFYPACRHKVDDALLDESYVEHDSAKVLIAELEVTDADEAFYDAKVKVLSEQILHHVHEEEKPFTGVFSQAKRSGLDMDDLSRRLALRKEEILADIGAGDPPPLETRTFATEPDHIDPDELAQGRVESVSTRPDGEIRT
jgi:hypothetical protein